MPERECLSNEVAKQCPIRVATGEQFTKVGNFLTLRGKRQYKYLAT